MISLHERACLPKSTYKYSHKVCQNKIYKTVQMLLIWVHQNPLESSLETAYRLKNGAKVEHFGAP